MIFTRKECSYTPFSVQLLYDAPRGLALRIFCKKSQQIVDIFLKRNFEMEVQYVLLNTRYCITEWVR